MNFKTLTTLTLAAIIAIAAAPNAKAEPALCVANIECDDGNPATSDWCNHYICQHALTPGSAPDSGIPIDGSDNDYQNDFPADKYHHCKTYNTNVFIAFDQCENPKNKELGIECKLRDQMLKIDATLDPIETLCCLYGEDYMVKYQNFMTDPTFKQNLMTHCGGKIPLKPKEPKSIPCSDWPANYQSCCESYTTDLDGNGVINSWDEVKAVLAECDVPANDDQCSIMVNVIGDFENNGQINLCCQVIHNSGTIESVEQTCSNGGGVSEAPKTNETPAPSIDGSPDAAAVDPTIATNPTDMMHIQGGSGGCSLIR